MTYRSFLTSTERVGQEGAQKCLWELRKLAEAELRVLCLSF